MYKYLIIFIDSLLLSWILIYSMGKILNQKVRYINWKYVLCFLICTIYLTFSYLYIQSFIKSIFIFLILTFICNKLYELSFTKSLFVSLITLFMNIISEIVFMLIITLVMKINMEQAHFQIFGTLLTNFSIVAINFLIINIVPLNKFFNSLFKKYANSYKTKIIFIICIMLILIISMVLYYIYFNTNLFTGFVFCLALIIMYLFLFLSIYNEKNNYFKLKIEYNSISKNLSEYEKLYSYQRLLNHEFKNDLMVIRGLSNNDNTKLREYIDSIVEVKNNKDDKWLNELRRIPEGGLLGILYYKLLLMDDKDINVDFVIGRNFESEKFNKISEVLKIKICKLIGIFLDNSIQAVEKSKEKQISIELDIVDSYFVCKISNNFSGSIDLSRIYEKGYTTKEKGHGYGLSIAKEIIEKEENIICETNVNGNTFSQNIKIKL